MMPTPVTEVCLIVTPKTQRDNLYDTNIPLKPKYRRKMKQKYSRPGYPGSWNLLAVCFCFCFLKGRLYNTSVGKINLIIPFWLILYLSETEFKLVFPCLKLVGFFRKLLPFPPPKKKFSPGKRKHSAKGDNAKDQFLGYFCPKGK